MENKDAFLSSVIRAMGFTDLNPLSRTAGCADRGYWHYQDGKGFPVGSFQFVALAFAAAAKSYGDEAFMRAAELSSGYWTKQILRRHALDEYFKGQKSFCATAHTTMAMTLYASARERSGELFAGHKDVAIDTALDWLSAQTYRPDSANQTIAARLAWDVWRPDRENPFVPGGSEGEGWLAEYHGFDLGYSLQCVDLCAMALGTLVHEAKRAPYAAWANRLLDMLHASLVRYTFAPALSSRGNPHRLIGGVAAFAKSGDARAREILERLERDEVPSLVRPENADDKYLAFFHLGSLLMGRHAQSPIASLFPERIECEGAETSRERHHLSEARLVFHANDTYRAALSLHAGGAVAVACGGRQKVHGVYVFRDADGLWASLVESGTERVTATTVQHPIVVAKVAERALFVQRFPVQIALKSVMAIPGLKEFLSGWILKRVTGGKRTTRELGARTVTFTATGVEIVDKFTRDVKGLLRMQSWCMTDGHSTRVFAEPTDAFENIGDVAAGEERRLDVVDSIRARGAVRNTA